MRRLWPVWTVALLAAACPTIVPLTPDARVEALAGSSFRVFGVFELHAEDQPIIVVKNFAPLLEVSSPDDTTILATVLGAQVLGRHDTLRLTFMESGVDGGAYTLRAINDTALGGSIRVGEISYRYVPCARVLGVTCDRPIGATAREDQQVRLGIVK
jgi:hypothetical protein